MTVSLRAVLGAALLVVLAGAGTACGSDLSSQDQKKLQQLTRSIDQRRNLERVDRALQRMQWEYPRNPDVFVQMARVQLNYSTTGSGSTGVADPPEVTRPRNLARAEYLVREALARDPEHADAWMTLGRIHYLRREFDVAMQRLGRAQELGADSPRLYFNLGLVQWAVAVYASDDPHAAEKVKYGPAIASFEKALPGSEKDSLTAAIALSLGELYAQVGDADRAERSFTSAVDRSTGWNKANSLHRRARFLLQVRRDVDGALRDLERARAIEDFGVLRQLHATALLVKAGTLCTPQCSDPARLLIAQARRIDEEFSKRRGAMSIDEQFNNHIAEMSQVPAMFPGLLTLREAGAIDDWSDERLSFALAWVAMSGATPADVGRLLDLGVNPNPSDRDIGNALHAAIMSRNVPVAMLLLERGADPTLPYRDGRSPLVLAEDAEAPEMAPVVARLLADPRVVRTTILLKQHGKYRPRPDLNIVHGDKPTPDSYLSYSGECHMGDEAHVCLEFYVQIESPGGGLNQWPIYVRVPRKDIAQFAATMEPLPE